MSPGLLSRMAALATKRSCLDGQGGPQPSRGIFSGPGLRDPAIPL